MAGIGIEGGHVGGPKGFAEVTGVRNDCVGEAVKEMETAGGVHGAKVLLLEESDDGDEKGEEEEADFFAKNTKIGNLQPAERPVVEKEEDKRDGDEHGFAHEAEGEEGQGERKQAG